MRAGDGQRVAKSSLSGRAGGRFPRFAWALDVSNVLVVFVMGFRKYVIASFFGGVMSQVFPINSLGHACLVGQPSHPLYLASRSLCVNGYRYRSMILNLGGRFIEETFPPDLRPLRPCS